jgi:hypothetical protein
LKSGIFPKAPISHPPLSQFNRSFAKPTGRHYTKYRCSPDFAHIQHCTTILFIPGPHLSMIYIHGTVIIWPSSNLRLTCLAHQSSKMVIYEWGEPAVS